MLPPRAPKKKSSSEHHPSRVTDDDSEEWTIPRFSSRRSGGSRDHGMEKESSWEDYFDRRLALEVPSGEEGKVDVGCGGGSVKMVMHVCV